MLEAVRVEVHCHVISLSMPQPFADFGTVPGARQGDVEGIGARTGFEGHRLTLIQRLWPPAGASVLVERCGR